jgi:hypothetical protein
MRLRQIQFKKCPTLKAALKRECAQDPTIAIDRLTHLFHMTKTMDRIAKKLFGCHKKRENHTNVGKRSVQSKNVVRNTIFTIFIEIDDLFYRVHFQSLTTIRVLAQPLVCSVK